MAPVAAKAASTISNGMIWVSSPRWPGANTPEATLLVEVMVATAGEGADWGGNGAPGADVILVDHVLPEPRCHVTSRPRALDTKPNPLRVRRLITRRFDLFGYGDTGGGCEADKLGWGGQTGSCGLGGVPDDAQQRPGLADDVIDGLLGDAEEVGQGSLRR